jgi:ribosome biogenesis protein Nip4
MATNGKITSILMRCQTKSINKKPVAYIPVICKPLQQQGKIKFDKSLQNIPIHLQKKVWVNSKAFIAENYMVSADYSQWELRIVAALSGRKRWCTFKNNRDIKIYGKGVYVALADVTKNKEAKNRKFWALAFLLLSIKQLYRKEAAEFNLLYSYAKLKS